MPAEEEDVKEAIIAYAFLLNKPNGYHANELDLAVEQWFAAQYNCTLDFEISDALAKLVRLKLVTVTNDTYQAISLDNAKQQLDHRWDNLFNYNQA